MNNKVIVWAGVCALCAQTTALADEKNEQQPIPESRLSFGFEYGKFFENRTDNGVNIDTRKGAPGLHFRAYHLWDYFGFFHSHSFLFPNSVETKIDGAISENYNYFFLYNFIIGPAFKIDICKKIDMTLGMGFSMGPIAGEWYDSNKNKYRPLSQFNIGAGGDVGFYFFVSEKIYINAGSLFTCHFGNVTSIGTGEYRIDKDWEREEIKDKRWSKNYSMYGLQPYITIGIRLQ